MNIVTTTEDTIEIMVSREEYGILGQCLNEVCNGFHIDDFKRRVGADREVIEALLNEMR